MTQEAHDERLHLRPTLGPVMLWGLGVGYVISGEYFGWNLGLPLGGTYGMLIALAGVTVMYVAFVLCYAEMACAIPRAGGVFVYGVRGLGMVGGYVGGLAQIIEFVFAPPAIAMAIGAYVGLWLPEESTARFAQWVAGVGWLPESVGVTHAVALAAYVMFTALNIWGVRQAATFELVVTVLAVGELVLFTGVVAPHFSLEKFQANAWPGGWKGVFAATPFAIWFYLAIEGVANAAEEAKNPQRDVPLGFGTAILTLVVLACCVFFSGVGVGGWERIVYPAESLTVSEGGTIIVAPDAVPSDSPLPLALGQVVAENHSLYHLLVGVGLLGLVASFNGIILIAGRALFEMGRVGFLPRRIGQANRVTRTPIAALVLNLAIGMTAILFLDTGALITMSAMGAATLYVVSMLAMMRLRRIEPDLARPYRAPLYPLLPIIALVIAAVALATMIYFNFVEAEGLADSISVWYFAVLGAGLLYYFALVRPLLSEDDVAHFRRID